MQLITADTYPKYTRVFNAAMFESPAACATKIHEALTNTDVSNIVVLRTPKTLKQSFDNMKGHILKDPLGYAYSINGDIVSTAEASKVIDAQELPDFTPSSLSELYNTVGDDFGFMAATIKGLGPSYLSIRAMDFDNSHPHLDGERFLFEASNSQTTQCGITATMSIHGGGSVLINAPKHTLRRVSTETKGISTKSWRFNRTAYKKLIGPVESFQAPDGALVIMKSNGWPEDHIPSLHKSPDRENDGDANERVVGVSFIPARYQPNECPA